jgi:Domain of unknown function (DUF4398)
MFHSVPASKKPAGTNMRPRLLLTALVLMTLTACASVPPPPAAQLQAAELAITSAEQARVADYTYPELNQAREKLAAARVAVTGENMLLAARLADESRVSAELASARAEVIKAKAVNDEMQQGLDTLKQELLRNSGTRQ